MHTLKKHSAFALTLLTSLFYLNPNASHASIDKNKILLSANFNKEVKSQLAQQLIAHPKVTIAKNAGADGSDAIRVAYVGYHRGSERVVMRHPLNAKVKSATLSFDVKFDQDFQWVRGGKLHGLGPKNQITGGNERKPNGWSARIMFRRKGHCAPYLYDQDTTKKYGIGSTTAQPVFTAGQWHKVVFQIQLNDPGKANGSARILIDNHQVSHMKHVNFRGTDQQQTLIQKFLFSTFHGGHTIQWAPKDAEGKPTTVYAHYDNFLVTEGLRDQ